MDIACFTFLNLIEIHSIFNILFKIADVVAKEVNDIRKFISAELVNIQIFLVLTRVRIFNKIKSFNKYPFLFEPIRLFPVVVSPKALHIFLSIIRELER